jgi:hypothetical protein
MSETSIIAIILGIITVAGTLFGTWFGRLMERSNETQKWRREECLEAYTKLLRRCTIVANEADILYGIECATLKHNKQTELLLTRVEEMYHMADQIALLAPQELYNKFNDLTLFCGKEMAVKSIKCPKLSNNEWRGVRVVQFATIFLDCRMAARNDLGLFPKRYRIGEYGEYKKSVAAIKEELSKGIINQKEAKQRLRKLKTKMKSATKEWDKKDWEARKNR